MAATSSFDPNNPWFTIFPAGGGPGGCPSGQPGPAGSPGPCTGSGGNGPNPTMTLPFPNVISQVPISPNPLMAPTSSNPFAGLLASCEDPMAERLLWNDKANSAASSYSPGGYTFDWVSKTVVPFPDGTCVSLWPSNARTTVEMNRAFVECLEASAKAKRKVRRVISPVDGHALFDAEFGRIHGALLTNALIVGNEDVAFK